MEAQIKLKSTECESKYTNLIKHIYNWSIESNTQINDMDSYNINKMREIIDLINQIDFKDSRYSDYDHKNTFNQLFNKFTKETFGHHNHSKTSEFYTKCLTLFNKFVHQKTDKTESDKEKETAKASKAHQIESGSDVSGSTKTRTSKEGEESVTSSNDTNQIKKDENKNKVYNEENDNEITQTMNTNNSKPISTIKSQERKRPERVLIMIDWYDTYNLYLKSTTMGI